MLSEVVIFSRPTYTHIYIYATFDRVFLEIFYFLLFLAKDREGLIICRMFSIFQVVCLIPREVFGLKAQ